MSDTNAELLEMLKNQLASVQKPGGASSPWGRSIAPSVPKSVFVPIRVHASSGEIRLSLEFADVTTPEAIMDLIASLEDQGYPLDIWKPRFSDGGGNRWSRSGGGWRK